MKYPRIAHLPFSNVTDADDIVTKADVFGKRWILTEKVDGSQLSIEFEHEEIQARNRNTRLLGGKMDAQFGPLPAWIEKHFDGLWDLLGNRYIVFGDWMFHVHCVEYDSLPDLFIAYDVFDKENQDRDGRPGTPMFLPFHEAMASCRTHGIKTTRIIDDVLLRNEKHLLSYIGKSAFSSKEMEGIVLHSPDGQEHYKYVTPAFKASVDASGHWRECDRVRNKVCPQHY